MGKSSRKNKNKVAPVDSTDADVKAFNYAEDPEKMAHNELVDNMEKLDSNSSKDRTDALITINSLLRSKPTFTFVCRYHDVMSAVLTLKNKPDPEAEQLVTLMCLFTLHGGKLITDLIFEPMSQMRSILQDESRSVALRMACANTLAIITSICCEDGFANGMACKSVWSSKTEGDGKLIATALTSWCFIILADAETIEEAESSQPKIVTLLSHKDLEVRLAAARTLAYLQECMHEAQEDFVGFPNEDHVLNVLREMMKNEKRTSKKDRKEQRKGVRDVLEYLETKEDVAVEYVENHGKETLHLNSFRMKMAYGLCCDVLKGGVQVHLKSNPVLRNLFGWDPTPLGA
ncbi:hypothetical protein GCK72_003184 [Caenorhabditis remanei]|uniref:Interferon-related developmental regulator N-terminal domain-containing protein n=1 Tax=Caenorhabditis remanei TaxID=31234 RepID=A0A6A5HTT1_CAERE|nr:hypothetical protein GCK72_003184 [Caenorhabditis remanei]KAF1771358.1 hypothetical protein GCK72_003184 [Caenorhabditis remanei]